MLKANRDVFAEVPNNPGTITWMQLHILTVPHVRPIKPHSHCYAQLETEKIIRYVQEMLKTSITTPSQSTPCRHAPENDTFRFCVDFRELNKVTQRYVYPLPSVDDAIDCVATSCFFATLDLAVVAGWPTCEQDKKKTAFALRNGLFEF